MNSSPLTTLFGSAFKRPVEGEFSLQTLLAKERSPIAADLSFEHLFLLSPATSESGHELIGIRAFSSIPIVRRSTEANSSLLTNAPTPNGSI